MVCWRTRPQMPQILVRKPGLLQSPWRISLFRCWSFWGSEGSDEWIGWKILTKHGLWLLWPWIDSGFLQVFNLSPFKFKPILGNKHPKKRAANFECQTQMVETMWVWMNKEHIAIYSGETNQSTQHPTAAARLLSQNQWQNMAMNLWPIRNSWATLTILSFVWLWTNTSYIPCSCYTPISVH